AILGSAKQMHTILSSECTGCELCLEPCPVDCIRMEPIPTTVQNWKWQYPVYALKVMNPDAPTA
ncbi:RnfABCDGE type electron transport complex subunit B, partial [Laribacter hongkongensis]